MSRQTKRDKQHSMFELRWSRSHSPRLSIQATRNGRTSCSRNGHGSWQRQGQDRRGVHVPNGRARRRSSTRPVAEEQPKPRRKHQHQPQSKLPRPVRQTTTTPRFNGRPSSPAPADDAGRSDDAAPGDGTPAPLDATRRQQYERHEHAVATTS